MVSEDSGRFASMDPPIPALTIHAQGNLSKFFESFLTQMSSFLHCPDDLGKEEKLLVLRAQKRLLFKEGNHLVQ